MDTYFCDFILHNPNCNLNHVSTIPDYIFMLWYVVNRLQLLWWTFKMNSITTKLPDEHYTPGAFQFSIVFSTIVTSCWDIWLYFNAGILLALFVDPAGFVSILEIFSMLFLKDLCFFFVWCVFHSSIFLPENIVDFLAVCTQHFVSIVLVLVFFCT